MTLGYNWSTYCQLQTTAPTDQIYCATAGLVQQSYPAYTIPHSLSLKPMHLDAAHGMKLRHKQHYDKHHHEQQNLPYSPPIEAFSSMSIGVSYFPQHNSFTHRLNTGDSRPLPTQEQFDYILNDYILSLSPKKRDKALITQKRYDDILAVLQNAKCITIGSAQFRFWVKKMFELRILKNQPCVFHGRFPVAVRESLCEILIHCHILTQHGGRDKTSASVHMHCSWVPKELIARFVKHCPNCVMHRTTPAPSETRTAPESDESGSESRHGSPTVYHQNSPEAHSPPYHLSSPVGYQPHSPTYEHAPNAVVTSGAVVTAGAVVAGSVVTASAVQVPASYQFASYPHLQDGHNRHHQY